MALDFRGIKINVGDVVAMPTLSKVNKLGLQQFMVMGILPANEWNPVRVKLTGTDGKSTSAEPNHLAIVASFYEPFVGDPNAPNPES